MAMVLLVINRAASLKETLKLFMKFIGPGENATFHFWPEGASLLASSFDGRIQASVELDRYTFLHYSCPRSCFYTLNLGHFRSVVDLVNDFQSVTILGTIAEELNITAHRTQEITYTIEVLDKEFDLNPLPNQYPLKIGISTEIFRTMLRHFSDFEFETTVLFTVLPADLEITSGNYTFLLSKRRNECVIEGVPLQQRYAVEIPSWQRLRSEPLSEAIGRTSRVWFYPSTPDGPPVMMCPAPLIGNIMFYFLQQDE